MSTNDDIQNQNTELQYENNFSETVSSKVPIINSEGQASTKPYLTGTPSCVCESDVNGDSQSAGQEGNSVEFNSNSSDSRVPVEITMEVDKNGPNDGIINAIETAEPPLDILSNVQNKMYIDPNDDDGEGNDSSTSSQSQQNTADTTPPMTTDSSNQNSLSLQTPDSIPDNAEIKSSSITPSSHSDISCSSQFSSNLLANDEPCSNEHLEQACASADQTEKPSGPATKDSGPLQSTYHIKWIKYRDDSCPIITQNENGPCPLIAVMNVLLLQRKVKFPPMMEMVTSSQLMDYLGDCILEYAPKHMSEGALLNYEQNMHDAMAVFHKLQTGLDVNVRFTGVDTFEYTSECIVFDLLEIHLYHGWLVDPDDMADVTVVGNNSYNQLVEMIIRQKQSPDEEHIREALVAEEFLNRSSHQLTYHGLSELASTVKENELCVFFRNNHFSTLFKHKNELFLLVTDQGFLTESNVVWETLSNVEGDGHFVDGLFRTFRKAEPSTHAIPASTVTEGNLQIDQDYLVALSLQQEQQQCETQTVAPDWNPQDTVSDWNPQLSDHEIAVKLQEEENRRVAAAMQRQEQQQAASQGAPSASQAAPEHRQNQSRANRDVREPTKKKDSECVLL